MDWENYLKKPDPKNQKNSKHQSEIAACEQKTTSEKANFCSNTVFYFKVRAKNLHAAKPLAFSLHFLFRRDQNHYSNLTSKIMKMCEQSNGCLANFSQRCSFLPFRLRSTNENPLLTS